MTGDGTDPIGYNPYSTEVNADPYPVYRRLRDEAPCYHNRELDFYALSRFDDVLDAFRDTETFTSTGGVALENTEGAPPMLITMDPPPHSRLRRLVSRAFTPRRVAGLEPMIRDITTRHLDALTRSGSADIVQDFSAKLPMDVISTMLGVPQADHEQLRHWADDLVDRPEGETVVPRHTVEAMLNLAGYFADALPRHRASDSDDMVTALCRAELELEGGGTERLTDDEIVGFCILLIVAGSETTTKLIGNAVELLDRHPEERRLLLEDLSRARHAVEEILRFNNSTQYMARTVTRPVTRHGVELQPGRKVLLLIGAANRDDREFADPDRFDILRRPERTLSFGHGPHACLGAALARMEGTVALEEIHRRIPDYRVERDGLQRLRAGNVHGWSHVPITFTPERSAA